MAYRKNITLKHLVCVYAVLLGLVQTIVVVAQTATYIDDEYYYINQKVTETHESLFLGVTGDYGAVIVTGKGTELNVNNTGTALPLPASYSGDGLLSVSGGGTLSLQGTGKIGFNGDALFDNAYFEQAAGTTLDVNSGQIVFDNGSVVTGAGTWNAVGGVRVNDSVLNVNGTTGILSITGGPLMFNDRSTLGITLDSSGNIGQINMNGRNVTLAGNLLVTPEYGYYSTTLAKPIILNPGIISGEFSDYRLSNSRYGTLDVNSIDLTFIPSLTPYSNFTQTFNERSVGEMFDTIHRQQLPDFLPLMRETWTKSDAELRALYNDLSGEIRAETMAMPLAAPGRKAFDRVGWDSATGHVFFGPQYRLAAYGTRRAAWFRPYYVDNKVESDGNASRYTMNGYGFVGGVDQTLVGGKTAVSVMLGYGRPELDMRKDRAKLDDFLIGAYLATRVMDAWEIKAWGGYGYQYYDMQRRVDLMGTPHAFKSNFKGHTTTISAELTRPIYTMSRLVLKPSVGYDGLFLTQDAGDETGHPLVALSYHKTSIERHVGRIGLGAEYGDRVLSLYGGAYYNYLLGGDQVYYSKTSFGGGGPVFTVNGVDLGKSFISANIGLQINLADDRSRLLFVDYNADFGDHSAYYQTATVGVQQTF